MKVHEDKRAKAGVLSLALDRYENSPKFSHDDVPAQMQLQILKRYERKVEAPLERRSISKNKQQKSAEKGTSGEGEQSEDDLFALCNSLSFRIQTLKKEKYQHVVQEFQGQQRRKMTAALQAQGKKIGDKYAAIRNQLSLSHEQEKLKIAKALDDVKKFRQAFTTMIDELQEKKSKVNNEYQAALSLLKEQKERLIAEWKRNSNQELFKMGLKNQ